MMKRIRIEKEKCFDGWAFRIAEQTHRGDRFGQDGQNCFQGSKKMLISGNYPKLYSYEEKELYVQGADRLKNKQILVVTIKEMAEIEQAIAEYNEFFSDG